MGAKGGGGPGSQAGESHPSGPNKGIGFARLDSHDKCERLIERYGGKVLQGASEPLIVKFADANKNRRFGPNANSPNSSSSSGSSHNSSNNNSHHLQGLAEFGALGGLGMGNALGGGMLPEAALANILGLGVGVGVPNGGMGALGPLVNQEALKTALGLLIQQQTSAAHVDFAAGSNAVNSALLPQLLQQQQQQTQGVNANQLLLEATLGQFLAQPAATPSAAAPNLNLQQLSAYLTQQSTATALARQQQQQQQQALMLQAQLQAMMGAQVQAQAHGHAVAMGSTQAHAAQSAALDTQQQSLLQQQLQSQSIPSLQHMNLAYSIAEVRTCFYCTSIIALRSSVTSDICEFFAKCKLVVWLNK